MNTSLISPRQSTQWALVTRRGLAVLLSAVLALSCLVMSGPRSAHAEPTSAEKQAEVDDVAKKLNNWQTELEQASNDYHAAIYAHDEAILRMEAAQLRIDAAQAIILSNQEKLSARASSMYRSGPLSFLDVLFGASSFEDFTTRWDLLNTINKENASLIVQNKTAKLEAESAHTEFSEQELVAAAKLAESEAIKVKAEETVARYEAELASLEAELAELVRQEQEAQRAREAEAAAARAAAEAAAQNNNNSNGNGNGNGNGSGNGSSHYTPPSIPTPSGGYGSVVDAAYSRLGAPYSWSGKGPDQFDCSGLTSWCYSQAGLGYIGASDSSQYSNARARLPLSDAQPGDVLWWPGHVGIYIGGGQYIDAPYPGQPVQVRNWNINNAVVLRF